MPISCSLLCRIKAKEGPELRGPAKGGVGPEMATGTGPKGQVKGQMNSQAPLEVFVKTVAILYGHVKRQVRQVMGG